MSETIPPIPAGTPPCLHVGYHKCASTTLQKSFFDRHPQIVNLRKTGEDARAEAAIEGAITAKRAGEDLVKGETVKRSAELWRAVVEEVRARQKLPVFSWERLTRSFHFTPPTDTSLPTALKSIVGEARVVVVIRNQVQLLESLYLSRIKPPSYETPEEWYARQGDETKEAYRYDDVIGAYQKVFGPENVQVMVFEQLASEPEAFARTLSTFIGVDPGLGAGLLSAPARNRRPSRLLQAYSRVRKHLLPGVSFGALLPRGARDGVYSALNRGGKSTAQFSEERIAALEDFFREQNRLIAKRAGLDLERYGYPL
jgi:hypothetical protein